MPKTADREQIVQASKNAGFTLIEIMAVVLIIGLLSTIVGVSVPIWPRCNTPSLSVKPETAISPRGDRPICAATILRTSRVFGSTFGSRTSLFPAPLLVSPPAPSIDMVLESHPTKKLAHR